MNFHRYISTLLFIFSSYTFSALHTDFTIERLGLFEQENKKTDGTYYGILHDANDAGYVTGFSNIYKGSSEAGQATWIFDGVVSKRIGLYDDVHVREDGHQKSFLRNLSSDGKVAGNSVQYDGSKKSGQSAWLYDGTDAKSIGLSGEGYENYKGYSNSNVIKLNNSGQAIGWSQRYKERSTIGDSAWLYSSGETKRIGLVDSEHTSSANIQQSSKPYYINESGQVTGVSTRFGSGAANRDIIGNSPWIFDGTKTHPIGLIDKTHTRNDGYRFSTVVDLNELGQVAGNSKNYFEGAGTGWSSWIYSAGETTRIGLIDDEYTRDTGYQNSLTSALNNKGQAIGYSSRFEGHNAMGESAWIYGNKQITLIGLTNSEHIRDDGYRVSNARFLNDEGFVTGSSNRYIGDLEGGQSAWLFKDGITKRVGLTDSHHTRSDGFQKSFSHFPNKTGQLIGRSERFKGDKTNGQTAWFYDPKTSNTHALILSQNSDGYADSQAYYLSDNGLVLGTYSLYGGDDKLIGKRAFYFTLKDGMLDLAELALDQMLDISDYGWSNLNSASSSNMYGHIVGNGTTLDSNDSVYILKTVSGYSVSAISYIAWGCAVTGIIFLGVWYRKRSIS